MATGLTQLIAKGYIVKEAVWFPLKYKTISATVSIELPKAKQIHYGIRGNHIYVSPELNEFLHTEDSATDPERPLKAICKFNQLRGGDKELCNEQTS